jgi:hypothetical protein
MQRMPSQKVHQPIADLRAHGTDWSQEMAITIVRLEAERLPREYWRGKFRSVSAPITMHDAHPIKSMLGFARPGRKWTKPHSHQ